MVGITQGSFEVKIPTKWTHEKKSWEEAEKRVRREVTKEKRRRKKIKEEKVRKKEDASEPKGGKAAKNYVFPVICGSRGNAVGAGPSGQMRNKSCAPLWQEARFPSQNAQST